MKKVMRQKILIPLICILLLLPVIFNHNYSKKIEKKTLDNIHRSAEQSYSKQWIKNPNFNSSLYWYSSKQADISDTNAEISGDQANFKVIGNKSKFEFYSDLTQDSNWNKVKNPNFPAYPDVALINSSGACVSHYWDEGADQSVAVNWDRRIEMPVNMLDYTITSANLTAKFNASAQATPSIDNNGDEEFTGAIDVLSDQNVDQNSTGGYFQGSTGDYVRFYVWVSDTQNKSTFEVAYNQTWKLGQDDPLIDHLDDSVMVTIPEETLIFYLTSVLSYDFRNFTITIGMRIWCEDNFAQDADNWRLLIIKSVNLTLTYEKNINQFSTVSWNQDGEKPNDVSNNTVTVNEALLDFEYKINETWPTISPNSEIRMLINNIMHSETIKLSSATTSFQKAKLGGLDVTSLIEEDKNINLTIQVYIADEFTLNRSITISIDNVYLNVSYTESFPDIESELQLFVNIDDKTSDPIMELPLDENLNITIKYTENQTGLHITNASVQLEGKVSGTLEENITLEHYSINVNTSQLGIGVKILTITAQKDIYETQQIQLFVEVTERDTELILFLDGVQKFGGDTIQVDLNETVNVTVRYRDFETKKHLSNASVNLIGIGELNETNNQYNISVNAKDLGQGFTVLTITAQLINYQSQSIEFYVEVIERETELRLFLNGIERYDGNTIQFEIDDLINITAYYRDNSTKEHVSNASVILVGRGFLNESNNQYNITINAADLNQGITVLSIFAQMVNYQPQSIQFYIEVIERSTRIELFLNSENKTVDPIYELTIGQNLNITVKYLDNQTGMHIDTAIVQLIGESLLLNFTRDDVLGQHYLSLNSTFLGIGVKLFSIVAQANNYQIETIDPRITINRINALIITESGESQIEVEVGDDVKLKIILNNTIFGGVIKNATVTYIWAFGQGELLEVNNTGLYEVILDNIQAGVYDITINAFAGDNYHFETYEITIIVNRPESEPGVDLSWLIYILIGAIVILVSFFGLYQKYYKYPPLVRKIRKIKKKIRKNKKIKPISLQAREELVEREYKSQIEALQLDFHQIKNIIKTGKGD